MEDRLSGNDQGAADQQEQQETERFSELDGLRRDIERRIRDNRRFLERFMEEDFQDEDGDEEPDEPREEEEL